MGSSSSSGLGSVSMGRGSMRLALHVSCVMSRDDPPSPQPAPVLRRGRSRNPAHVARQHASAWRPVRARNLPREELRARGIGQRGSSPGRRAGARRVVAATVLGVRLTQREDATGLAGRAMGSGLRAITSRCLDFVLPEHALSFCASDAILWGAIGVGWEKAHNLVDPARPIRISASGPNQLTDLEPVRHLEKPPTRRAIRNHEPRALAFGTRPGGTWPVSGAQCQSGAAIIVAMKASDPVARSSHR
jgi:hypothetical protein